MSNRTLNRTYRLCCIGLMAAVAFVSNYIRVPFLDSQIHIGNAMCVLCGLFFGPLTGFLTAGLGNLLFDIVAGYGAECLITFFNKGCIALVAGLVIGSALRKDRLARQDSVRLIVSCVLGALTYVALYMLKTYIYGLAVEGLTAEAVRVRMLGKLPASLINAAFASVASPVLTVALISPLKRLGVIGSMQYRKKTLQ